MNEMNTGRDITLIFFVDGQPHEPDLVTRFSNEADADDVWSGQLHVVRKDGFLERLAHEQSLGLGVQLDIFMRIQEKDGGESHVGFTGCHLRLIKGGEWAANSVVDQVFTWGGAKRHLTYHPAAPKALVAA